MIKQLTVFLENREGRLAALCRTLANAGVNMQALTISESSEYGLVRIICDDVEHAHQALEDAGFRGIIAQVSAIEVPNRPGGLADLLETLAELGLNVEYGYCFYIRGERAVDVVKIDGGAENAEAVFALERAGFKVLTQEDLL